MHWQQNLGTLSYGVDFEGMKDGRLRGPEEHLRPGVLYSKGGVVTVSANCQLDRLYNHLGGRPLANPVRIYHLHWVNCGGETQS